LLSGKKQAPAGVHAGELDMHRWDFAFVASPAGITKTQAIVPARNAPDQGAPDTGA
jgi:hypothetical protein